MLAAKPEVGDFIVALITDNYWDDGATYQTAGKQYEVVGISPVSGAPYFIDDLGGRCHIDEETYDMYEFDESDYTTNKKEESVIDTFDKHVKLYKLEEEYYALIELREQKYLDETNYTELVLIGCAIRAMEELVEIKKDELSEYSK